MDEVRKRRRRRVRPVEKRFLLPAVVPTAEPTGAAFQRHFALVAAASRAARAGDTQVGLDLLRWGRETAQIGIDAETAEIIRDLYSDSINRYRQTYLETKEEEDQNGSR